MSNSVQKTRFDEIIIFHIHLANLKLHGSLPDITRLHGSWPVINRFHPFYSVKVKKCLKLKTSWWIYYKHKLLLPKMSIDGVVWITCDVLISCLDSHSDGTHSLQRINWWACDVMIHYSKSVQMKKQTHLFFVGLRIFVHTMKVSVVQNSPEPQWLSFNGKKKCAVIVHLIVQLLNCVKYKNIVS